MRIDQQKIVRTALRLLDRIGLESLSMRRLSDELGVHVSALYWHFKNKQALIDAMAKAISSPFSTAGLSDDLAWDSWLEEIGRAWRKMMLSHRDGALVITAVRPHSEHFVFIERILKKLVVSGFTESEAIQGFFTMTSYVLGFVLEEQRGPKRGESRSSKEAIEGTPLFKVSVKALSDRNSTFEHGLRLIVNGMRAELTS
jgi:TetR/AcrR family transcriptional regulator, tetracycline repressor protein